MTIDRNNRKLTKLRIERKIIFLEGKKEPQLVVRKIGGFYLTQPRRDRSIRNFLMSGQFPCNIGNSVVLKVSPSLYLLFILSSVHLFMRKFYVFHLILFVSMHIHTVDAERYYDYYYYYFFCLNFIIQVPNGNSQQCINNKIFSKSKINICLLLFLKFRGRLDII